MASETDERTSYRISGDADQIERERERLGILARHRDPMSHEALERTGIGAGWRCLEVGAGSGSIAAWMAGKVRPGGRVVSVDIDTRFHVDAGPDVEVRRVDVTRESLGEAAYDLVHARALLQHLHQRREVLGRMVAAVRPGGWLVVEDSDFTPYVEQELPEPFGSFSRATLEAMREATGWDGSCGRRLLAWFRECGLVDCDATGRVFTMHGGTPSAEWYVSGIARTRQGYIDSGRFSAEVVDRAIAQAREPDFAVLSPLSISVVGRRPG